MQGNGIDRGDHSGCNGAGFSEEVAYTLNTADRHAVAYDAPQCAVEQQQQSNPHVFSFDSLSSNSMKSSNPASGCREVDIAKCIDTGYPSPDKNQGGIAIVHVFESHPQDARIKDCGNIAPTRTENFAKGTADTPLVLEEYQEPAGFNYQASPAAGGIGYQVGVFPTLCTAQSAIAYSPVVCMAHGQSDAEIMQEKSPTLTCNHEQPIAIYSVECHPQDSRVKIDERGTVQTLTEKMGTGGGNVPLILYAK